MSKKTPKRVVREFEEAIAKLAPDLPKEGEMVVSWTVDIFVGNEPKKGIHANDVLTGGK